MRSQKKRTALSQAMHACPWVVCIVFLAGCASQPVVEDYVVPTAGCCSSIAEFRFRTIPLGEEVEFTLTAESPAYAFDTRRQHFVALKIPDGFAATTIQVRTYLSTGFLPSATAVIPEFIYLDRDHRILERKTSASFQEAGGFWRTSLLGRTEVPGGARYIVVVASNGSGGRPVYHSENRTPYSIPPAALGNFTLRLFGETLGK